MHIWLGSGRVHSGGGRVHADYQNMGVSRVMFDKLQEMSMRKYGSPLRVYGEYAVSDATFRAISRIQDYVVLMTWVSYDRNN